MAELVDAHDSKSCSPGSVGSSPTFGTISFIVNNLSLILNTGEISFKPAGGLEPVQKGAIR